MMNSSCKEHLVLFDFDELMAPRSSRSFKPSDEFAKNHVDVDTNHKCDSIAGQNCGVKTSISDKAFEDVVYPKGDPDVVSITKRDADLLRPDTFINDTIVDFYMKYLNNTIEPDQRHMFHFFNSFFFRKLADLDKNPSSTLDGRAAFQRVRKWTRKIDLFEKDYVFIPVIFDEHWSLVVICHPGDVAEFEDVEKSLTLPCILHLDSIRGSSHSGWKDLLRSYLWEEWKERHRDSNEVISSKFSNLMFQSPEIPQQPNSYDCGLFLLHYVELFLDGVYFNPFDLKELFNFLIADWFQPVEASLKRTYILELIQNLKDEASQGIPSDAGSDRKSTSDCCALAYENGTTNDPSMAFQGNALSSKDGCDLDSFFADFLKPEDFVGSFSQAYDQYAALNGFENDMPPIEGSGETITHSGYPPAAETWVEELVDLTSEACSPSLSTEFRGIPSWISEATVHQTMPGDINSFTEYSAMPSHNPFDEETVNESLVAPTLSLGAAHEDQSSLPSTSNKKCLLDCFGSAPILDPITNNNSDKMLATYPPENYIIPILQKFDDSVNEIGMCQSVHPISDDTYSTCSTKRKRVTASEGLLATGIAGDIILDPTSYNLSDQMFTAYNNVVATCLDTTLLPSLPQVVDTGGNGLGMYFGVQSFFDDTYLERFEHHATKRRRLTLQEVQATGRHRCGPASVNWHPRVDSFQL